MQIGEVLESEILEIISYGAWVLVKDTRVLVKLPDISWDTFSFTVEDVLSVGDKVNIKIMSINGDDVFGSIRDAYPNENPWLNPPLVNETYDASVVLVAEYGYMLLIKENTYGLMHIDVATRSYEKNDVVPIVISEVDIVKRQVYCRET